MKLARWAKVAFTTAKLADEKLILLKSASKRSTVNILVSLSDTHRERLCFTQFSTGMAAWLLLSFFKCLHNQIKGA